MATHKILDLQPTTALKTDDISFDEKTHLARIVVAKWAVFLTNTWFKEERGPPTPTPVFGGARK